MEHELTIFADTFTPLDQFFIPTGEIASLDNHFADFRKNNSIVNQLKKSGLKHGFNCNYVLNEDGKLKHAANLYEPESGRLLEIWTTQPAIQLYTAGYLGDHIIGKEKIKYGPFHGLCLEGQYFPDAPNHVHFPSTILRPNEIYNHVYCMKFKTR